MMILPGDAQPLAELAAIHKARQEQLELDAARYRWLKSKLFFIGDRKWTLIIKLLAETTNELLDAAIDGVLQRARS